MNYSLRDKIAQKLLVGIPNKESVPGVIKLIKEYHIGGVVLYKNNYSSMEEMIDLVNKLKSANSGYNIPLTIAIDQEGGRVNRLPNDILNIKSVYRLCESGKKSVKEASSITANLLNQIGVNMNFAPVLDIRSQNDDNAFIGNRAFSSDINVISEMGAIYIKEHIKNNVIPVIKHYPGHGNINIDSHFFLPMIKNFSADKNDVIPFRTLMNDNAPAIMVGHILINGFTKYKPATLSKDFITGFIKRGENYNGLIITDELGMRAIRFFYGKYRSMKYAFLAGNDIICCKYSKGYIENSLKMLETGFIFPTIDESFSKIIDYKKRFNYNDDIITEIPNLEKINKKISILNDN